MKLGVLYLHARQVIPQGYTASDAERSAQSAIFPYVRPIKKLFSLVESQHLVIHSLDVLSATIPYPASSWCWSAGPSAESSALRSGPPAGADR
ncbi:hypothetical protein BJX96DRAFT_63313 [Aspergillus floccosus]